MSKQSLSPGFKESLVKITAENAVEFAKKVVAAFAELEDKYNKGQDQLASAITLIDEQSSKLETVKLQNPHYRPTVQVKKDTYRINHGMRSDTGEILTTADIAKNVKLVESLIASNSTAVTKLTEDEIKAL